MAETLRCPTCSSEKILSNREGDRHACESCGHKFTTAKPHAALRIFLSYGHDANEELVRRIKADMEKRGHDVWFDKSEIKEGDDWRNPLAEMLARNAQPLPDWLGRVINSRPEFDVKTPLHVEAFPARHSI